MFSSLFLIAPSCKEGTFLKSVFVETPWGWFFTSQKPQKILPPAGGMVQVGGFPGAFAAEFLKGMIS